MVGRKPRRAQSLVSLHGISAPGLSRAVRVAALKGRLDQRCIRVPAEPNGPTKRLKTGAFQRNQKPKPSARGVFALPVYSHRQLPWRHQEI
jgi:hypothetical protein